MPRRKLLGAAWQQADTEFYSEGFQGVSTSSHAEIPATIDTTAAAATTNEAANETTNDTTSQHSLLEASGVECFGGGLMRRLPSRQRPVYQANRTGVTDIPDERQVWHLVRSIRHMPLCMREKRRHKHRLMSSAAVRVRGWRSVLFAFERWRHYGRSRHHLFNSAANNSRLHWWRHQSWRRRLEPHHGRCVRHLLAGIGTMMTVHLLLALVMLVLVVAPAWLACGGGWPLFSSSSLSSPASSSWWRFVAVFLPATAVNGSCSVGHAVGGVRCASDPLLFGSDSAQLNITEAINIGSNEDEGGQLQGRSSATSFASSNGVANDSAGVFSWAAEDSWPKQAVQLMSGWWTRLHQEEAAGTKFWGQHVLLGSFYSQLPFPIDRLITWAPVFFLLFIVYCPVLFRLTAMEASTEASPTRFGVFRCCVSLFRRHHSTLPSSSPPGCGFSETASVMFSSFDVCLASARCVQLRRQRVRQEIAAMYDASVNKTSVGDEEGGDVSDCLRSRLSAVGCVAGLLAAWTSCVAVIVLITTTSLNQSVIKRETTSDPSNVRPAVANITDYPATAAQFPYSWSALLLCVLSGILVSRLLMLLSLFLTDASIFRRLRCLSLLRRPIVHVLAGACVRLAVVVVLLLLMHRRSGNPVDGSVNPADASVNPADASGQIELCPSDFVAQLCYTLLLVELAFAVVLKLCLAAPVQLMLRACSWDTFCINASSNIQLSSLTRCYHRLGWFLGRLCELTLCVNTHIIAVDLLYSGVVCWSFVQMAPLSPILTAIHSALLLANSRLLLSAGLSLSWSADGRQLLDSGSWLRVQLLAVCVAVCIFQPYLPGCHSSCLRYRQLLAVFCIPLAAVMLGVARVVCVLRRHSHQLRVLRAHLSVCGEDSRFLLERLHEMDSMSRRRLGVGGRGGVAVGGSDCGGVSGNNSNRQALLLQARSQLGEDLTVTSSAAGGLQGGTVVVSPCDSLTHTAAVVGTPSTSP